VHDDREAPGYCEQALVAVAHVSVGAQTGALEAPASRFEVVVPVPVAGLPPLVPPPPLPPPPPLLTTPLLPPLLGAPDAVALASAAQPAWAATGAHTDPVAATTMPYGDRCVVVPDTVMPVVSSWKPGRICQAPLAYVAARSSAAVWDPRSVLS
jgi:hypothetical protein